ncbi:MAG: NAD(P)-dependent alcohol dehydrogenase [Chloroflexi bacterium]|nr:NAD(P)-dependent alcohol dehydrogenase [Chloroflexota bacterium]
MKTIVYDRYGSPDVLRLEELAKPNPTEDRILVKVVAAATNAADWHYMRGSPAFARLAFGLTKPKTPRLGLDFAGVVEAIGPDVTAFKPGDAVFGAGVLGAFSEYHLAREKGTVHKPENVSFEDAAAVPTAGLTALQGLRDAANLQAGQRVLINGASGGVGTFAVQIAKCLGAEVTGVCSSSKVELTRKLGADHVFDYTKEDFTRSGQQYDLIFDGAANYRMADYARVLKGAGQYVAFGFSTVGHMVGQMVVAAGLRSATSSQQFGMMPTTSVNQDDLRTLGEMLEKGQIKPLIDRRYPLEETAAAIRYLEEGHARGKVMINVAGAD